MNYKKWNKTLLASVSFAFVLTMAFNYLIDPYYVFNTPQINGVNRVKNHTIDTHMSKFYAAKRSNAKVLLIGTSRTEHIHPKYLMKYTGDKIYNLSLLGSGIDVQKNSIKYFVEKEHITEVVLGLDFFSFNPKNTAPNSGIEGTRYADDYSKDYLDSLLSIRTLRKSIQTLKENIKGKKQPFNYEIGWRSYEDDYINIEKYGNEYLQKRVAEELKVLSSQDKHFNYPPFKEPDSIKESLNELQEIINVCKANNVKLHMFISPIYSQITDLIYSRGYDETYNHWKRELAKYGNVYDFSGYNSITMDISNYVDGSHYQTKLAPMMFAKIFNDTSVDVAADFGTILNTDNIEDILTQQNLKAKK